MSGNANTGRSLIFVLTVLSVLTSVGFGAPGKSQTTFTTGGVTQDVFNYRPANFSDGPLLIVMHGLGRNADGYRDYAVPLADRFGLFVAAPLFDTNRFPSAAYQRGNVLKDGQPQPKDAWTYSRVAELARELRRRESDARRPLYLIGHSAGGQFLTRYAAFLPGDATRIVAANPGSHLFPTRDLPFPYGFGGLPDELGNDDAIKRYLAAQLTLLLGTADIEKKDLDLSATAMKQGATRLERGRNCFALARDVAKKNGWPLNWRLVEVPGVGHSGEKMFAAPQAAEALFGNEHPVKTVAVSYSLDDDGQAVVPLGLNRITARISTNEHSLFVNQIALRNSRETLRVSQMPLSQVSEEFKAAPAARRERYYAGKRLVSELKAGMTQAEVLALMGRPDLPTESQAMLPTQQWQYQVGRLSCLIMLDFIEGKLVKFVFMG